MTDENDKVEEEHKDISGQEIAVTFNSDATSNIQIIKWKWGY